MMDLGGVPAAVRLESYVRKQLVLDVSCAYSAEVDYCFSDRGVPVSVPVAQTADQTRDRGRLRKSGPMYRRRLWQRSQNLFDSLSV